MSIPEVARAAGLSPVALYRIESGLSENPRLATIKKLERALGESVDAEIEEATEAESEIEGLGEYQDFDPHDEDDLPRHAGVYVLYDISERPIYVGKSDDIRRRIGEHSIAFWFRRPIVESGAYLRVEDAVLRNQIEKTLIRFLKRNAVINKQNVER